MHINIENIYSVVELKVKLIVIINTVHFPLIADRRSVIVPEVPFIFKRKIRKQLTQIHKINVVSSAKWCKTCSLCPIYWIVFSTNWEHTS